MKVRPFSVVSLIVSLALLLALVPGGAVPTAAQAQPASVQTPAPAPVRVAVALQSTPVMFVENVGQFDPSTGSGQGDEAHFQAPGALTTAAPGTRISRIQADFQRAGEMLS